MLKASLSFVEKAIQNLNPPSPHIPKWFVKELTDLGGKCDDGKTPQLRVVWGGSAVMFWNGRMRIKYPKYSKKYPVGWEIITHYERSNGKKYKTPGKLGIRKPVRQLLPISAAEDPQYATGRIVEDWLDIGKEFFFLEEWLAPDLACEGWEDRRYQRNKLTGAVEMDKLGPEPRQGFYRHLLTLKTDDEQYMAPNEQTLLWIRKMLWLQLQDPNLWSKRERPPSWIVEQKLRDRYALIEKNERIYEDMLADMMMERARRSTLNPTSFPSVANNKGGIIIAHK